MSNPLLTLTRKITWQLQDIAQQLLSLEEPIAVLDEKNHEIQQKILRSSSTPACILPEQEMARLNFMLNQQRQQDEYAIQKKLLISQQERLQARYNRLKMELKRIEKHQSSQLQTKRQQDIIAQQRASDERYLQYREQA